LAAMANWDLQALRSDFPILGSSVNGRSLVYLDNAATSQKPRQVLEAVDRYYREQNGNIHRGVHYLSQVATDAYDRARDKNLRAIDASHLFEPNTIQIGIRRNHYLRGYMFAFIELFAPHLKRAVVEKAITEMATRRAHVGESIAAHQT
jgi:hypothetical protein